MLPTCVCGMVYDNAGSYSNCPACGRPLATVSLEPMRFGSSASSHIQINNAFGYRPVLVEQSIVQPSEDDPYRVLDAPTIPDHTEEERRRARALVRKLRRHAAQPAWELESHWWQCLAFPLRATVVLGGLAFGWSLLLPFVIASARIPSHELPWKALMAIFATATIAILGATIGFCHNVLSSALHGEASFIPHPLDPRHAGRGLLVLLVSFLGGPAILLLVAGWYALNLGEMTTIDEILLVEIMMVAGCWWLFAFLSVVQNSDLRAVAPLSIVHAVRQLGWPAVTVAGFVLVVLYVFVPWLRSGVTLLHQEHLLASWFVFLLAIFCGLAAITFGLRWLGVRAFRAGVPRVLRLDS